MNYLILLIAVAFGVGRFFIPGPSHPLSLPGTYEAFAHILVGSLFGAWLASKDKFYLCVLLALTAVETVAFFTK